MPVAVWRDERLHQIKRRIQDFIQSDGPFVRCCREMPSGQFVERSTKVRIGESCTHVVIAVAQIEERIIVPDATQEGLALPLLAGRFV